MEKVKHLDRPFTAVGEKIKSEWKEVVRRLTTTRISAVQTGKGRNKRKVVGRK